MNDQLSREAMRGVPVEERTREQLIETVRRLQDSVDLERGKTSGMEKRFMDRLKIARKAKQLANQRADAAYASAKAVIAEHEKIMKIPA